MPSRDLLMDRRKTEEEPYILIFKGKRDLRTIFYFTLQNSEAFMRANISGCIVSAAR